MDHPRTLLISIPGGWEWLVILLVVLIFFGNRIPGMARALGSGINEFKSGLKEGDGQRKLDGGRPGKPAPPRDDETGEGA